MHVVLGLLGAAIGGPVGFLLVGMIFSLANPGKGCVDGLRVISWLPFMFMGLLVVAVAGAYWTSRLPDLFWAWQYDRRSRCRRPNIHFDGEHNPMSDTIPARLCRRSAIALALLLSIASPLAYAEEDVKPDREQIGEVLGKPVYRDQIRTGKDLHLRDELLRLFAAPVMEKYRKKHKKDLEPTKEEIDAATAFFDRAYRENMEDDEATLRRKLQAVEKQLAEGGLTDDERRELERDKRLLQVQLKLPGRNFAIFMLESWKLQRHLYEKFGGGRVLWQQAGMEAFDAMHNWLST